MLENCHLVDFDILKMLAKSIDFMVADVFL